MANNMSHPTNVYLEIGSKKVIAGAIDWPGWSRRGRDEASAIQALIDYGPPYARAIESAELDFRPPATISSLDIIERLPGNASTDFGGLGILPAADTRPFDAVDVARSKALLSAALATFDHAVSAAEGKQLRKGPRGGGRDLDQIVSHVMESNQAYLGRLAWKLPKDMGGREEQQMLIRRAMFAALEAAARGELPEQGPRGGKIWPPRFFVRVVMWHMLDHVWEIEDRCLE